MTFPDRVQALTREALLPKVEDTVLTGSPLPYRLMTKGKKFPGMSVKKALKYQNSSTATSFAGMDTFTASPLNTKVKAEYDVRAMRQPIAMGGMEISANETEAQVTRLVTESVEETQDEMVEALASYLYGTGTGNSNKDFIGLGAIVDDATDVSTIGGLARSTYSILNATRTASGGTLTLAKLATLTSTISQGTASSTPSFGVTSKTVWDLYESLLTPTVRETYSLGGYPMLGMAGAAVRMSQEDGFKGNQGFTAISFRGVPIVADPKCTAQNLFMLNEKYLQWYGLPASKYTDYSPLGFSAGTTVEGVYADAPYSQYTGFSWSGLLTTPNAFGKVADVIIMGNLTSWGPNRHGRLTGITGV